MLGECCIDADTSILFTSVVMRLLLITLESGTAATAISVASLVYYLKHPSSSNLIVIVSKGQLAGAGLPVFAV